MIHATEYHGWHLTIIPAFMCGLPGLYCSLSGKDCAAAAICTADFDLMSYDGIP